MVLTPRPKRKKPPKGCMVALLALPLVGAGYFLTAPLAFDLLEVVYWLAVMSAALSGLLSFRGDGWGNVAAWPIVASAYAAAFLDWANVPFDPWLWRLIDVAAIAGIIGLRRWYRVRVRPFDFVIFALMLPCWWLYERDEYLTYVGVVAVVIVQCAFVVIDGLAARRAAGAGSCRRLKL